MTALRMTAAGLALALAGAPLAAQAPPTIPVDTTGVGALIDQGMTKSQVMQNLQYLSDIVGPRLTAADTQRMRDQFRGAFGPPSAMDSARRAHIQQFNPDQPFLLRNAGALAIVLDGGKEQDLLNMSGSPTRVLPLPQIVVAHEEYALFDRLLQAGEGARVAASVHNHNNNRSRSQAEPPGGD